MLVRKLEQVHEILMTKTLNLDIIIGTKSMTMDIIKMVILWKVYMFRNLLLY